MRYKTFCYETWLDYMDEMLSMNAHAESYESWIQRNKWYLRKVYRVRYTKLQKDWEPNYEHFLPTQRSD